MPKFRKLSKIVDAEQFFVADGIVNGKWPDGVTLYKTDSPCRDCKQCGHSIIEHGWIGTLEGGHIVCDKDWIITGVKGEKYPCKSDIFEQTYVSAENSCKVYYSSEVEADL